MRKIFQKESMKVTRRGIQIALGLFWILDGLLQLQPRMFTPDFANSVIAPAADGQAWFVSQPMQFFIHIFLLQPALFNVLVIIIQIGLGVLILYRRTANVGLWFSVAWGLFVWYIGEGLSGLTSGHASLLMGAPGAALIYALLALAVSVHAKSKKEDVRPAHWLLIVWAGLWGIGALYQLLPGQNTISNVTAMISMNASSAPAWMAAIDNGAIKVLNDIDSSSMQNMNMAPSEMAAMPDYHGSGAWFLILIAIMQLVIGFIAFLPGYPRWIAVSLGSIFSLIYWVIGQSMGAYFSGLATDPNAGPLFILLGIAILGCTQHDKRILSYFARIRRTLATEISALNEG